MRVVVEKVEHVPPAHVVVGMGQDSRAAPRPRKRNLQNLSDARFRTIRHQNQSIGEV